MTGANEGFLRAVETQSECGGGEAGWLNTDSELDHKKMSETGILIASGAVPAVWQNLLKKYGSAWLRSVGVG